MVSDIQRLMQVAVLVGLLLAALGASEAPAGRGLPSPAEIRDAGGRAYVLAQFKPLPGGVDNKGFTVQMQPAAGPRKRRPFTFRVSQQFDSRRRESPSPEESEAYSGGVTGVMLVEMKPGDYVFNHYYMERFRNLVTYYKRISLIVPVVRTFTAEAGKVVYLGLFTYDENSGTDLASTGRYGSVPVTVRVLDRPEAAVAALELATPGLGVAVRSRMVNAGYLSGLATSTDVDIQALADALRAAASGGDAAGSSDVSVEMQDGKLVMRIGPPKTTTGSAAEPSTPPPAPAANPQTPRPAPETPLVRPNVLASAPPPSTANCGAVWTSPADGKEMVYVPAGGFLMGSADGDKDSSADEKPQHRVYLDAFWIDKTEVTVAEYRRFCEATGREMPPAPSWGWHDDHPVSEVTWDDAAAYATWVGKRLPTEAEWEKAARGTDGRPYPWGNEWGPGKCANQVNSDTTQPVGSYPAGASPYGALDMAGNVEEWCADWYGESYYRFAPARNSAGPPSGEYRLLRGGSWLNALPRYFRGANRNYGVPDIRGNYYGFRCVRGPA